MIYASFGSVNLIRLFFFSVQMSCVVYERRGNYREGYFATRYLAFPRATMERPNVRNL